jgi:hypothetical protein
LQHKPGLFATSTGPFCNTNRAFLQHKPGLFATQTGPVCNTFWASKWPVLRHYLGFKKARFATRSGAYFRAYFAIPSRLSREVGPGQRWESSGSILVSLLGVAWERTERDNRLKPRPHLRVYIYIEIYFMRAHGPSSENRLGLNWSPLALSVTTWCFWIRPGVFDAELDWDSILPLTRARISDEVPTNWHTTTRNDAC